MNAAAEDRALARLELLRAGAIVAARLDNSVASLTDADGVEEKQLGHIDGMRQRSEELAAALLLSPARAATAILRVRRSCSRTIERVERELAHGDDEGPTYEMGLAEADMMVLRMWPAPLGPPPSTCPACGSDIEPGEQRAHTSADEWVCPACYLGS